MKGIKGLLIVSGIGISAYALFTYYKKQVELVKNIDYKLVGLRIGQITKDIVSLDLTAEITNSSNLSATIKSMYLEVFFNGVLVGTVTDIEDLVVQPTGKSSISFQLKFSPSTIAGNVLHIITAGVGSKDVSIEYKGYVKVKSDFIAITVPYEYRTTLKSLIKK
jgi:LEA14-like dessication related protein